MTINLEKSLDVAAPVQKVFAQWKDFTSYPRFMRHIQHVRSEGENKWIWATPDQEWQVEITHEQAPEQLSWRISSADHPCMATLRFTPLENGGTNVLYATHYPNGLGQHQTAASMSAEMELSLNQFAKLLSGTSDPAFPQQTSPESDSDEADQATPDQSKQPVTAEGSAQSASKPSSMEQAPEQSTASELSDLTEQAQSQVQSAMDTGFAQISDSTQNLQRTLAEASQVWTTSVTRAMESFATLMFTPLKGFALGAQQPVHTWTPQFDVKRQDGMLFVSSELPGYSPDDLHVEIRDGQLWVSGERQARGDSDDVSHDEELEDYQSEQLERFEQSMSLNAPVDAEHVEAELTPAGQLRIALPIKPQTASSLGGLR